MKGTQGTDGPLANLLNRGWVPNHTTPLDLIVECGDDDARLDLIAYQAHPVS